MPSSVLITGSNQGLGYHCAVSLVKGGHRVILACRNVNAANKAADTIAAGDAEARKRITVLSVACDLASLGSVRSYAKTVISRLGDQGIKLNSLVLNAGIGGMPEHVITEDGFEKIFESNVLGHFLLAILLLPHLAKNARVVSVSSEVHDVAAKTGLPDPAKGFPVSGDTQAWESLIAKGEPFPQDNARNNGGRRYSRSKLLDVLFANQLARILSGAAPFGVSEEVAEASVKDGANKTCRLPNAGTITSVSMNPGLMLDTGFVTGVAGKFLGTVAWLLIPLVRLTPIRALMRDQATSGSDLAKLAVDPEYAGITAAYFDGATKKPSSEFSRELESVVGRQAELWERLMEWAKVTGEEKERAML